MPMRLKSSYIVILNISFAMGEFDASELYSTIVSQGPRRLCEQMQAKQHAFN